MRENAAAMDKLVRKAGKMANLNAVEDLKTYQEFTQVRLDGMKNLISSFKTLYDSMPADQKKNADQVFEVRPVKPATAGLGGIMTKRIPSPPSWRLPLCRPRRRASARWSATADGTRTIAGTAKPNHHWNGYTYGPRR